MSKTTIDIKLPGYYIGICKENKFKEQIIYFDSKNNDYYYGTYGIFGFHDVTLHKNYIRNLTDNEKQLLDNNKYIYLPQQFYQSMPN